MQINPQHLDQAISHLQAFVTENRQARIENVLHERTRYICTVLENVYQPHNISAVLRSSECLGIQDCHIIENENTFKPNKAIAMGASQWLSIHRYNEHKNNTHTCIQTLKQQGYRVAALCLQDDSIPLNALDLSQKTALLIGTEETGLTDTAMNEADVHVMLPMQGFTQSFNLSVCAALCMNTLSQKLRESEINWKLSDPEKQSLRLDWFVNSIPQGKKILSHFLAQMP